LVQRLSTPLSCFLPRRKANARAGTEGREVSAQLCNEGPTRAGLKSASGMPFSVMEKFHGKADPVRGWRGQGWGLGSRRDNPAESSPAKVTSPESLDLARVTNAIIEEDRPSTRRSGPSPDLRGLAERGALHARV
jgi:hypothetical protein